MIYFIPVVIAVLSQQVVTGPKRPQSGVHAAWRPISILRR